MNILCLYNLFLVGAYCKEGPTIVVALFKTMNVHFYWLLASYWYSRIQFQKFQIFMTTARKAYTCTLQPLIILKTSPVPEFSAM